MYFSVCSAPSVTGGFISTVSAVIGHMRGRGLAPGGVFSAPAASAVRPPLLARYAGVGRYLAEVKESLSKC